MRSQTIAPELFAWRIASACLFIGVSACFGTTTPPSEPTKNPLDDAPPAEKAPPPPPPEQIESKKNKFDEEQAKIVLARADKYAHTCVDVVDKDQPHGDTTVTVTFSGAGKSIKATLPPPFDGTPIGQCATRAFVNIIVPPFDGPDVDMTYPVDLKPGSAPKKEGSKSKK